MAVEPPTRDPWDTLQSWSEPGLHWTRSNVGEAMPGVPTPLSWSLWSRCEGTQREAFFAIGAFSRAERAVPERMEDRYLRIFYGHPALQVEFLVELGDRMPGSSGEETAQAIFGRVPDDIPYRPTKRRYPVIAWHLPLVFLTVPGKLRRAVRETDGWYADRIARIPGLDRAGALAVFEDAAERFYLMVRLQTIALVGAIQPLYGSLAKLVAEAGVGDMATLSGSGGAEMVGIVGDIWRASRGRHSLDQIVSDHGFHGPMEGELSSRVWREDPEPLRRLIGEYADKEEGADPTAVEEERRRERQELERQVIAAVPARRRPSTRLILALSARRIPLRGVVKRCFLQSFDVARASARRLGESLAAGGELDDPEDVFYLTAEELTALSADARALVALRRERRADYQGLEIPGDWTGMPEPRPVDEPVAGEELSGIGVSPGVTEGVARVLMTPDFSEVAPGEILVAPTTDPSWSSVMFISAALVVDIGGPLSHAAVVARELGIPCVVNTRIGTRAVRTGDRVRVDGATGVVEVLTNGGQA
jgi:phosphohistidine swiveling domain-containing protein